MTSTNFNIGLTDNRNSSRVLRPPGGGHTDIFGSEPLPVKKNSGRNVSSIMEGTNQNTPAVQSPVKTTTPTQPAPQVDNAPAAPRSRVPPGGFSSGLW